MLVTGPLTGDTVALVLVLHHALADGVGGLAVLVSLVDGGAGAMSTNRRAATMASTWIQ